METKTIFGLLILGFLLILFIGGITGLIIWYIIKNKQDISGNGDSSNKFTKYKSAWHTSDKKNVCLYNNDNQLITKLCDDINDDKGYFYYDSQNKTLTNKFNNDCITYDKTDKLTFSDCSNNNIYQQFNYNLDNDKYLNKFTTLEVEDQNKGTPRSIYQYTKSQQKDAIPGANISLWKYYDTGVNAEWLPYNI